MENLKDEYKGSGSELIMGGNGGSQSKQSISHQQTTRTIQ